MRNFVGHEEGEWRERPVGILTTLRAGRFRVRVPSEIKDTSPLRKVHSVSDTYPALSSTGSGVPYRD